MYGNGNGTKGNNPVNDAANARLFITRESPNACCMGNHTALVDFIRNQACPKTNNQLIQAKG